MTNADKPKTNADKYLKDGVDVNDFVGEFNDFCAMQTSNQASSVRLAQFLSRKVKPTLTEDEKVILSNIDENEYQYISRNKDGALFLNYKAEVDGLEIRDTSYMFGTVFRNHLFQFIQPRRRI